MPSEKGSPWSESNYHRSVLNTKLKIWLRRNLFGEFGQTESTSAVKILLMGNNALLFLACLICCCNLRHCGCLPRNTSSRLPFSLVHHDTLSCTRFITSQRCNQIYLAERKMETHWRAKFEFSVAKKNCKQNVQCNKTRSFRLFLFLLFLMKAKKNFLHIHFNARSGKERNAVRATWQLFQNRCYYSLTDDI